MTKAQGSAKVETMPGKVTEEDFPQLNPSAMKKEVKTQPLSFGAITDKVREEEEQRKLEDEEAELTARLEEIKKKKEPVAFKTPVCLPRKTQAVVAPKKEKEIKEIIQTIGVARAPVSLAPVPMPPVFERQSTSIFAKPSYLQDIVSDSESEEEEPEYKPRMLVFDRAEIDDEDW